MKRLFITARIKTPELKSYDETLTLPREIHLGMGPVPMAIAVYDGEPDVTYEDLGALCDAHKLDPEAGLAEVTAAEHRARDIKPDNVWIYLRSEGPGARTETLTLVRLHDDLHSLAILLEDGSPDDETPDDTEDGEQRFLGVYDLSGEQTLSPLEDWLHFAIDDQLLGEEAVRVAHIVGGKLRAHGREIDQRYAGQLVESGGARLISMEIEDIFLHWNDGEAKVSRWRPGSQPAPALATSPTIDTEDHRRSVAAEILSETREDWEDLEADEQRKVIDEFVALHPQLQKDAGEAAERS